MIDPHVHLRDWNHKHKETVLHGLRVAYQAGLDAVFEMPNTSPALTSRKAIEERINLGDDALKKLKVPIFHGIYAGLTDNPEQIKEMVEVYNDYFPRVVGLKMFSGHSTGNMGLIEEPQQEIVYKTLSELNYRGVLVNHCEKEQMMNPNLWNFKNPFTHTLARPPESEVQSVKDQIRLAHNNNFEGTLHIAHLSVPDSYYEIDSVRNFLDFNLTCEVTPHHSFLYDNLMNDVGGNLLKVNPPLRPKNMQEKILELLLEGKINYIATDHAPHAWDEKMSDNPPSGIPGIPYLPIFAHFLKTKYGRSESFIDEYTHDNILKIFNISPDKIPNTKRGSKLLPQELIGLSENYSDHHTYNIILNYYLFDILK